jgi:NAD(P)-dependent dehydrogenase (short-subunit alcohol dehydrogenase family)
LDVTKEEDILAANEAVKSFLADSTTGISQLHSIVNNAGIMFTGSVEMYDAPKVDDFYKMMDVNFYGMVRVTRMFLPLIRKSRGRIINVTSSVNNLAIGGTGAYSCTKAAASKFTEILQTEVGRMGVITVAIEPWIVKTNLIIGEQLLGSFKKYWNEHTSDEVKGSYGEAWYQKMIAINKGLIEFPYNSTTDMVVKSMVDGVTSYEPQAVYRVTHPLFDWILWIVNEWPSWELKQLFRWLFDLLMEKTL